MAIFGWPSKASFIQNLEFGWYHSRSIGIQTRNYLAHGTLDWGSASPSPHQMICIPQFSKDHKSGNKIKIEMNIQDIFQRGKAKPLEVGSFQSILHSNSTFYPKRSSTSHQSAPCSMQPFLGWSTGEEDQICLKTQGQKCSQEKGAPLKAMKAVASRKPTEGRLCRSP